MSGISGKISSIARRPTLTRRGTITAMVLVSVFIIAIFMRIFPAKYGFYLNEFDPYYDYRAADFIVKSFDQSWNAGQGGIPGLFKYFSWIDYSTWFPEGRNVAPTSQDGLQFAGALLYLFFRNVLGLQSTLYDFLVLFPVFIGALTAVVFYFLVKKISGVTGGLFAALMVAVSPPLIQRGNLGWFKSEPLAIFLFAVAAYIFLTLFDTQISYRQRVVRAVLAGLLIGYANTSWGGSLYFSVAFGLFFLILPFLNLQIPRLAITTLLFTVAVILASAMFPRPGIHIVTNPAGFVLIIGTVFMLLAERMQARVKPAEYRWTLTKILLAFVGVGLVVVILGLFSTVSRRYLTAIMPWVRSGNPLVESVAKHFVPTGGDYFSSYLVLLFIGVFGAYMAFRRKSPVIAFALVVGITSLYISSAFSRLLVYSSIAFAILGGIGFAELIFSILKPSSPMLVKRKMPTSSGRTEMRALYSIALIALISFPASIYWIPNPVACTGTNVICNQSPADYGVSITNGGTVFAHTQINDWREALQWMRDNTPKDAVIISWWDYGYWTTVMGNRTSVADNATLNQTRIAQIGKMFMSNVTTAAATAKSMAHGKPVYVMIFVTGSLINFGQGQQFYALQIPSAQGFAAGGGDESKKQWFIRIGGLNESEFLEPPPDGFAIKPEMLNNTLFGEMLPFKFAGFYDFSSQQGGLSPTWALNQNGAPPIQLFYAPYEFGLNGNGTQFKIAFHSSSLDNPISCASSQVSCFSTVLIYQVL